MFIEIDNSVCDLLKSLNKKINKNEWLEYWESISNLINLISSQKHVVFFGRNLCNALIETSKNTDDLDWRKKGILIEFKKNINDIYSLRKTFNFKILVKKEIETSDLCVKKYNKNCSIFEIPLNFFKNFDRETYIVAEDENDCNFYDDFCKIFLRNYFCSDFFSKKEGLEKYLKISFDHYIMHGVQNANRIIQSIEKEKNSKKIKKFFAFVFDNDEDSNGINQNKKPKENIEKFCKLDSNVSWFHTFKNIREMENLIPLKTYKRILPNIEEYHKMPNNIEDIFSKISNEDFYHIKIKNIVQLKSKNWNKFLENAKLEINKNQKLFLKEVHNDAILLEEWKNLFKFLLSWCCSLSDDFARKINNKNPMSK